MITARGPSNVSDRLEGLLGVPFAWAMVVGTALFVFYVALGGTLAVIWTNVAQFLFLTFPRFTPAEAVARFFPTPPAPHAAPPA